MYDHQTKQWYNFIDLTNKYNIPACDFLIFMSLIACIPAEWKTNMNTQFNNIHIQNINENDTSTDIHKRITKVKEANKFLYSHQLKNDKPVNISSQEKWSSLFENLKWDTIYKNIFSSTIDVKLRKFQYKYIFRIIPTNKRLFTQNIANSNLCDFCSMDIENLNHLFWECNHVQIFWNDFNNFMRNVNLETIINFKTISFGAYDEDKDIKNFIIFYAKYFIFLSKCRKTIPRCELFKSYITKRIQVEKEIALMNDKLYKFETKWRFFNAYI